MTFGVIYTIPRNIHYAEEFGGEIVTKAGARCAVEWEWEQACYSGAPADADFFIRWAVFDSEEAAHALMAKWIGHPWYRERQVGDPYEIVKLTPRMVQQGWELDR